MRQVVAIEHDVGAAPVNAAFAQTRPYLAEELHPQCRELLPRRRRGDHRGRTGRNVLNGHLVAHATRRSLTYLDRACAIACPASVSPLSLSCPICRTSVEMVSGSDGAVCCSRHHTAPREDRSCPSRRPCAP